jgi:putative ABC transport system permease protein
MAYIIAVFTSNTIEREEVVIGTLYSLGVQKLELIRHYMKLPLLMVFISAIIGLIFGMFGMSDLLASDSVALYSMPELEVHTNIWIFIYAIVMPIAITIIVNFLVLNKKLSRKPIDMLRKNRSLSLRNFGKLEKVRFKDAFRFRQFTSEIGSNLILIGGIFIASLLLVLGFTIEHSMDKYVENVTNDLEYQYQYVVAGPVDTIPEGAEAVYDKMLTHQSSSELDVVLEGIESKSEYFSFAIEAMEKEVYISDAFAKKFGYVVGDRITLVDNLENEEYSFKVAKIVPYNYGLYIFMNIDQMRQYFDEEEGYYNGILSKKELSLPEDMVISTTSQKNVIESAEALKSNMSMMMLIMDGLGLIIFALVLFLLVKLIITKASFSISLIKIFGYKLSEVITIYLGSTTCIVLLGVVVSVPVSNVIMGKIYPFFTANIPAYIESGLNTEMFIYLIVYMLVVYLLVNVFLVKQLSKIRYTQILKDRE